jgi:hypothetical protein
LVLSVAFSPGAHIVHGSSGNTLSLFDAVSGAYLLTPTRYSDQIHRMYDDGKSQMEIACTHGFTEIQNTEDISMFEGGLTE